MNLSIFFEEAEKVTSETTATLKLIKAHRARLTRQQYSTLKGQVMAGDSDGAMRGLDKILRRAKR